MNMDFKSAKELLDLCEENQLPISEVMRQRECILGETPRDAVDHRMAKAWEIMHASATQPLKKPIKSMGGLIGGEAKKLETHYNKKKNICGDVLQKAMTYAMAVLEVNASMGLIVAAPTAGSAGVVPGMMLALQECYRISDQRIVDALFNAGAVGYLAMRNATVAGAVGGCQAEVGIASAMAVRFLSSSVAMAASAAVELMGGDPQQCLDAASTVLMNMLGLVCDPVGGLVEYPCQNRNAAGVANALIAAELSLSGIRQLIPFDQMLDAMYAVGKRLPAELRETALGGCAATPAACAACGLCSGN
jgi:L-serine dehydratase